MKPKKKIITETLTDTAPYEFEGSLATLRSKVDEWIKEYGPDTKVDWNPYFHYDYDPDPSPRFEFKLDREETDEEYEKRIAKERAIKSATEERERAEYERLQKKFERKK